MGHTGISPAGLVLSGVLDIRHRFLRLIAGVRAAMAAADPGTRSVLTVVSGNCELNLTRHAAGVKAQLLTAELTEGDNPERWPSGRLQRIAERAVSGFLTLSSDHAKIYAQVPGTPRLREDLKYLLYRSLDLSLVSKRHELLISAIPSESLQWQTLGFQSADGLTRTASVAVPWLESLGPLRWPLLVHEVGHHFLPHGESANAIIDDAAKRHAWRSDAFEEILADAVAQRYIGAAYSFALAREGYLYSYKGHVTGGLSIQQRLEALGAPSDLLAALPAQWQLGQRRTLSGESAEPVDDAVVSEMREVAMEVLRALDAEFGGPSRPVDLVSVSMARPLLAILEPAPAVLDRNAQGRVKQALRRRRRNAAAPMEDILDAAVHRPLSDAEIYEAAWREEVDRPATEFVKDLLCDIATPPDIDREVDKVVRSDECLARSLQSAAVHRWLVDAAQLTTGA